MDIRYEIWASEEDSDNRTNDGCLTFGETAVVSEPATANDVVLELVLIDLQKLVGQTKDEVLEILGPAANVDHGATLADHYIKGGEVYDVLYFRPKWMV